MHRLCAWGAWGVSYCWRPGGGRGSKCLSWQTGKGRIGHWWPHSRKETGVLHLDAFWVPSNFSMGSVFLWLVILFVLFRDQDSQLLLLLPSCFLSWCDAAVISSINASFVSTGWNIPANAYASWHQNAQIRILSLCLLEKFMIWESWSCHSLKLFVLLLG